MLSSKSREFDLSISATCFSAKIFPNGLIDEWRDFFYPFVAYLTYMLFVP
jgi:hypothetical protein